MRLKTTAWKVWLALYASAVAAAQTRDAGRLQLHLAVDRVLEPGRTDVFRLDAAAGQYLQVVARQKGIHVVLRIADPAGKTIIDADSPGGDSASTRASWIAQLSGVHSVQVSRPARSSGAGHYEIEWKELRQPVDADRAEIDAEAGLYAAAAKDRATGRESRQAAIQLYRDAASAWKRLQQSDEEALCFYRIGAIYSDLNDEQKAVEAYQQAVAVSRAAGDRSGEGAALLGMAIAYHRAAEHPKALENYQQALAANRAAGERTTEATTLFDMGLLYSAEGDTQKALECYQQTLTLRRAAGDRSGEARALTTIGNLYRDLGASDKAIEYYHQALPIEQAIGERSAAANTLTGFGDVYFFLGDKQKSLDYYQQAVELKRAAGERSGEALALIGLANVYCNLGGKQKGFAAGPADYQKALDYYQQALAIGKATNDPTVNVFGLMGAGVVYSALGDKQKALDSINQALFLFDFVRYRPGQGWGLYEKARVERDRGNLAQALTLASGALDIVESIRSKTAGQELRTAFLAAVHDCFELQIDILMRLHAAEPSKNHHAEALAASERARARVLLETLGETYADIREGVDPALLQRETNLQNQINARETARIQMLAANPFSPAAADAEKTIRALTGRYEETRAEIRARSPRYAALVAPQPLSVAEIQQRALDSETLLLEYSLGEQGSFLWVVSPSAIHSFTLPKRSEIEEAAKRFYNALSSPDTPAAARNEAGKALSRILLGGAAPHLGKQRLLIVADGALQYLPFAALPDPAAADQPLVVNHEVAGIPSASTLAVLRGENQNRKPAPKTLAVFADPVFSPDDPRLSRLREKQTAAPDPGELQRSLSDFGQRRVRLPRLPGTRREAAAISALIPAAQRKQALDFDANRAAISSPEITQYRILHLATHGLLNSVHPELSGVVLSLVDRNGKPQDGFLRLNEIYNLKLSADLVVLSACQTGLGKEIRGEGLVGLTRGFMYAGTPRVVASLWKVDDRATAELMQRFYRGMLEGERLPAAAALRAAQVAMWKTRGWENPYYWAAFTLQGEWR